MAATDVTVARVVTSFDSLWTKLKDVLQIRTDVTTLGGATFLVPALDGDPDPIADLSSTQLADAMTALAAVNNALAANDELHRKAILGMFMTPEKATERSRASIREFRTAMTSLRAYQTDLTDAADGTPLADFLTAQVGAELSAKTVAALTALTAIDTTLNAGAGTRRKDLRRAAD